MQTKKDISKRIDELEEEVRKLRIQLEALELRNNDNNRMNQNKIEICDYVKSTNKPWHEGIVTQFGTKKYWVFLRTKDGEKRKALTNVIKFYS